MTEALRDQLAAAVRAVLTAPPRLVDEGELQRRLVAALGTCDIELRMQFDDAVFKGLPPPPKAIAECAAKGKPIDPDGKDACSGHLRKLDILWHVDDLHVPVELKIVTARKSDVYGYQFLKDLHRLERLRTAAGRDDLTETRFAIFATSEALYWKDAPPEPVPFRLFDGRTLPTRYWVQYDQPSARTRWLDYPPFHLANSYRFDWHDAGQFGRFLLVPVRQQQR